MGYIRRELNSEYVSNLKLLEYENTINRTPVEVGSVALTPDLAGYVKYFQFKNNLKE